jgi:hypothetical protein
VRQARQLKTRVTSKTSEYKCDKLDVGYGRARHRKIVETTETWVETDREMECKNNIARRGRGK